MQDLTQAEQVLAGLGVDYLQAPLRERGDPDPIPLPRTFAQLLFNTGFGRLDRLRPLASAWRSLLELVRPELIVFDHSPTAMLAARGLPAKKALIGTGFFCPPDEYPMSDMRPWLPPDPIATAAG